jgi:predicted deacylase
VDVRVGQPYGHGEVVLPVVVVRGRKPGPHLFVSAAIHGDEINGVEIIRRLLHTVSNRRLNGALIAVPIVNVYGFMAQSRYLPDRRDLNRSFPGSARGSLPMGSICTREASTAATCPRSARAWTSPTRSGSPGPSELR